MALWPAEVDICICVVTIFYGSNLCFMQSETPDDETDGKRRRIEKKFYTGPRPQAKRLWKNAVEQHVFFQYVCITSCHSFFVPYAVVRQWAPVACECGEGATKSHILLVELTKVLCSQVFCALVCPGKLQKNQSLRYRIPGYIKLLSANRIRDSLAPSPHSSHRGSRSLV